MACMAITFPGKIKDKLILIAHWTSRKYHLHFIENLKPKKKVGHNGNHGMKVKYKTLSIGKKFGGNFVETFIVPTYLSFFMHNTWEWVIWKLGFKQILLRCTIKNLSLQTLRSFTITCPINSLLFSFKSFTVS